MVEKGRVIHTDNGYPSLLKKTSQEGEKYDKTTAILVRNDSKGNLHEKRYAQLSVMRHDGTRVSLALTKQHIERRAPRPHHGQRLLHFCVLAPVIVKLGHRYHVVRVVTPADDVLHDLLHGRVEDVLADLDDEEEQDTHCHDEAAESLGGRNVGWQVVVLQQRCCLVGFGVIVADTMMVEVSITIGLDIRAHAGRLSVCCGAVSCHDGTGFRICMYYFIRGPLLMAEK